MANTPPVATINDHSLRFLGWSKISNWLTYTDADGNPATKYQFWDSGTAADSGFIWSDAGTGQLAANTTLEINAADLSKMWVRAGAVAGSETMWVRAFDGTDWGNWDAFTLTSVPNTTPVATISDHTVDFGEWTRASNWISYSDADGDAATRYQFWDSGTSATSGYIWSDLGTGQQPTNTVLDVAASDLSNIWFRGGSANGTETLWVRAYDGQAWGNWDAFTLTTQNTAPVATISDQSVHLGAWTRASNWISYSDADGDAATRYQFWDSGTAATSGYIWSDLGTGQQPTNTTLDVAASDLSNIWFRGGSAAGTETLWVRAFDGHQWGNWDAFTLTTQPNTDPVAGIPDLSVHMNQWVRASNWLTYSDADGDAPTQFEFFDGGTLATSGYIWSDLGTGQQAAGTTLTVAASDVSQIWLRGGSVTGNENMFVRAFDGHDWSNWQSFQFNTVTNTAPVAAIADHSLHVNEWTHVSNWLSAVDPEGDTVTQYQFWDGGGAATSGYIWSDLGTGQQASGTALTVAASDVSQIWLRGGSATGSETMYVRAFDGIDWGAWDSFTLTTIA